MSNLRLYRKWPDIKGLHEYKGLLLHTASWTEGSDLNGKSVAVIGSGSSALQVIPNVQPIAQHMDCYIRSATYIPLPLAYDYLEAEHCDQYAGDRKYSQADQDRFASDKEYLLQYRKTIESGMNEGFKAFHRENPVIKELRNGALENMKKLLSKKPELYDLLAPKWEFGCRRPSPGIGFLEALCADNVAVVKDEIECFTATGIRTADGKERDVDAIICATGFDVSWRPRFRLAGKDGFELDAAWAREPRSYISIAIENMPNYFIFNGPYNCGGNGNAIPPIEIEGDYMIQCINKIQRQNIRSMTPQLDAIQEL
jgi:cation diffusion facilitator CzcD-associated flavoprotein CzcO